MFDSEGTTIQSLSATCCRTHWEQNSFATSSKNWAILIAKFASFKTHSLLVTELSCHVL